jgi:hypothetical protein
MSDKRWSHLDRLGVGMVTWVAISWLDRTGLWPVPLLFLLIGAISYLIDYGLERAKREKDSGHVPAHHDDP